MKQHTSESVELPYEAPRVETIVTADTLARQIQYAGDPSLVVDGAGA